MNLLNDPWIPVRSHGGTGEFRLITYQQLLCESGDWQVTLPRDDLEIACLQLLICLTQVMFLPEELSELRERIKQPLSLDQFEKGIKPCQDWFDLDHPTQPFMQTRGVKADKETPIQKLLIGLPEGNNHAFFNEPGEVSHLSGSMAAIALFNQASNCPSFGGGSGGGFKGSLRGNAPITTLVYSNSLRELVWHNVLTKDHITSRQISISGFEVDQPTWIQPISEKTDIHWNNIGLNRGLFWQPARIELVKTDKAETCDLIETIPGDYTGFIKQPFGFQIKGVWPHPHGSIAISIKKNEEKKHFISFNSNRPAWTQLSELVISQDLDSTTDTRILLSEPIIQSSQFLTGKINVLIGGYSAKQASILERRHDLLSLGYSWNSDSGKNRLKSLVSIGLNARDLLLKAIFTSAFGHDGNKGIGIIRKKKNRNHIRFRNDADGFHDYAEKLFYARTEHFIHETFSNDLTFREWGTARKKYAEKLTEVCRSIFKELTDPYRAKPELIPIIAWAHRNLNHDLKKLLEEST